MTVCTVTSRTSSRYKITYIVTPFLSTIPHQQVMSLFFFFNDPATPEIYPLPLHDALPIPLYTTVYPGAEPYLREWYRSVQDQTDRDFDLWIGVDSLSLGQVIAALGEDPPATERVHPDRSEEHTSELQSRSDLVCRLLLEKK